MKNIILDSAPETKCRNNRITVEDIVQMANQLEITRHLLDCQGLNVAIILGMDSSSTKAIQRKGRVIRLEPNKKAEIFTLVLNNTKEEAWFQKSHPDKNYITLDVENLYRMLKGEEFEVYHRKEKKVDFDFRF